MRNAVSRRRSARVSKSNSISSKISMSGTKVIVVPVLFTARPFLNLVVGLAALVVLLPDVAVAPDLQVEPLRERVDDRDADAVQAAGDLVAAAVAELAAGVQGGQHDLGGGLASSFGCFSTGMPRPSSTTVTLLSGCRVTVTLVAWPAIASSTELSTTS